MISLNGTYKEINMVLPDTTIGTANYTARIFDVTGEVLHDVTAINGIQLQWITPNVSLITIVEDAITEIARQHPEPEPNAPMIPVSPLNW